MTTSQEWAERLSGYVPTDPFDGVAASLAVQRRRIDRVRAVQPDLSRDEAADQINTRIYEARLYLKRRAARSAQ